MTITAPPPAVTLPAPVGLYPPPVDQPDDDTTFYLGAHHPSWLATSPYRLFVSHRRLRGRKRLPRARAPWALDSGGFMELTHHGGYRDGPGAYIRAIRRYNEEIGNLKWAAIQDWMCEPGVRAVTGRTVREHQWMTCHSYCMIRSLWRGTPEVQVIPVLQGWDLEDYTAHYDMYRKSFAVDLDSLPLIGVGSVCRRSRGAEIQQIIQEFADLPLHGFGVKTTGLKDFGHLLSSADSMAWSLAARFDERLPDCTHRAAKCANCWRYATQWRAKVVDTIAAARAGDPDDYMTSLFGRATQEVEEPCPHGCMHH